MPGYQLDKITEAANYWSSRMASAKKLNNYEEMKDRWDQQILAQVEPLAETASGYTAANARLVEAERKECQSRLDAAVKLLKAKQFGAKEAKAVAGFHQAVAKRHQIVQADNSLLTQALAPQYRGNGWTKALRAALSDEKLMQPMLQRRAQEVKLGSTVIQMTRRIAEYEARLAELAKEAATRADKESQYGVIKTDLEEVSERLKKDQTLVDDLIYKARRKVDFILGLKSSKTIDKGTMKTVDAYLPDVLATGKEIRGHVKTMDIALDSLLKRSKAAPGFVQYHKADLKAAGDTLSTTKKAATEFDKAIGQAEKIAKKLEKIAA
jgi:hypothetical protein